MKHRSRILLAGMLGNLIESFDMAICGLLAVYLAKYLIGNTDQSLLIVFATFFVGYLARPIGASILGLFSDIYGRKITLAASILSMGIATSLVGIIPSSTTIGSRSLIFLVILRVIQSFCCGAEYLNSSAYLVENADDNCKGFSGCWASFGAMSGLLLASITALAVSYYIEMYPELEWAIWRIPFLLALFGSSIGLYIRLFIPESMEYVIYYSDKPKPDFITLIRKASQYISNNKLTSLYVFFLSFLGVTTTFQIYIFAPVQAHIYGNFTDHQIILSNILSLLVLLAVFPVFGRLSDKIKREKIVVTSSIGFIILAPVFLYWLFCGTFKQFLLVHALIALPASAYYATVPVMLAEFFPINLRCSVLSILYSTAASLAAGLTPVISMMLIKNTGSAISPFILIAVLVTLSLGVMKLYLDRNTRNHKLLKSVNSFNA